MGAWMQADEYAVEWRLNEEARDANMPTRPAEVPQSIAKPAPAHVPAHAAKRRRPQAAADDYYARRAKEEIARMHEMFSRNTYREELRAVLLEAKRRQAAWEKEKAA